jgi:PAS domain S-box-containing protein
VKKKTNTTENFIFPGAEFFYQNLAPMLITNKDSSIVPNKKLLDLFGPGYDFKNDLFQNRDLFDSRNFKLSHKELPFLNDESKSVLDFLFKVTDANLGDKWFRVDTFSVAESDVYKVSFFHDVTDAREQEQSISETLNSIQTVFYSSNAEGTDYNFISDAVRTLFGFTPEEIYGNKTKMLRSIYPDDFMNFKKFIKKLKSGNDCVVEYRMKDRFGKEHWIRHSGIPIKKGGETVRVVGTLSDITEEKIIQLKLVKSEERFRLLVDTADDLIFILDGFGYFWMVNKNGARALGYTPEEMKGRHFLEFIDKEYENKITEAFSKILVTEDITTFEAVFLDRFDRAVTFEINAKPVMNEGEITGMLSIGRNITRRKADEQKIKDLNSKLIEANRIIAIERERARHKITVLEELNKLKSEFISNVSHELRTPLASIVGFAETIESDSDLPPESVKEFSNIILTEGKRLARLINDLLDFSKLDTGVEELHKENSNIVELATDVIKSFKDAIDEKKLSITTEFAAKEIVLSLDKERISKVLFNLLSNALKFTNPGGRISVLIQDFDTEVEIAVSDTGVGIPEKEIPNLFQKFTKVQRIGAQVGGTGFGLVTVKQIVDLHKGIIKVSSEVDKGSTFIIRLPK